MNKKQLVGTLLATALLATALPVAGINKAGADELSASDSYFLDFIAHDIGENEIEYVSSPLYDENLTVNGYEYEFVVAGIDGYALIHEVDILGTTLYEMEELVFDGVSPFANAEGLPVFVSFHAYWDYKNGNFYDLTTGETVSETAMTEALTLGFNYNGGANFTEDEYDIQYTTREIETYGIPYGLPHYDGAQGTSCAHSAGAVVLAYYDRFHENLIPNYQVYMMIGGVVAYLGETATINALTTELYTRMGSTSSGTTFAGFNAGLSSYAQDHGFTYSTSNLFSGGSFNFNSYKTAVETGQVVALFFDGYAIYLGTIEEEGVDTIKNAVSVNTHIAVGCGYKVDTYYDENGNVISQQKYLRVASGLTSYRSCYFNINGYGSLDQAIAVNIQ